MIVTAIDREFLPGLRALHNSIKRHSPDTPLACLTYGDDSLADEVRGLGVGVHHNLDVADFLPSGEGTDEGCQPMYARLIVPMLYDECVWMDADQITRSDLSPLFSMRFDQPLAAVPSNYDAQRSVVGIEVRECVGIMSGLMAFNTKEWRKRDLTAKCIEIMKTPNVTFRFVVQSVLNVALAGNFHRLDPQWQGFANRAHVNMGSYKVLHWHGRDRKPWTHPGMPNADTWRQYE